MKKLILSLVLAAIALPAMALTTTQQAKLDTAMATLSSFGINPVVLKDDIGEDKSFYALSDANPYSSTNDIFDWVNAIQDKFVSGDMFVKSNGSHFTGNTAGSSLKTIESIKYGTDLSFGIQINTGSNRDYTWLVNGVQHGLKAAISENSCDLDCWTFVYLKNMTNGHQWSYPQVLAAAANAVENYVESAIYMKRTESAYDAFIDSSDVLYRQSDKLDVGGAIGRVIVGKAKELKTTVKDVVLQTVAAEIGKSAISSCGVDSSVFICASIGDKFRSITSQLSDNIHIPISYEYQGKIWKHVSPGSNMLTATYTQPNGLVVTSTQALSNIYHKTGFVTIDGVSNTQHYNDMLFDVGEIADAYITIMDEDFTFSDLAD